MIDTKIDIRQQLAEVLGVSDDQLMDEARLADLVQESFMLVELVIQMQEAFGITLTQNDLQGMETVADLIGIIEGKLHTVCVAYG